MKRIEILGLQSVPEIKPGDNLSEIIVRCAENEIGGLQEKDIVVLTSKIVSKADGLLKKMSDVKPGPRALMISRKTGKNAQWLQMIFDEGHEIIAILPLKGIVEQQIMAASGGDDKCTRELIEHEKALCITVSREGRVHTCDAGIDGSNHERGVVSMLPRDPDRSAKEIREKIQKQTGKKLAVILADTEVFPFGTIDLAVGSSGISPRAKMFGKKDLFGKPKFGGIDLVAYELTAASALVFGQINAGIPVAIIRGYEYEINETENISNTLLSKDSQIRDLIKQTLQATSYAYGWNKRLLLRTASWFI